MKKALVKATVCAVLLGIVFSGCSKKNGSEKKSSNDSFKIGVIYIGDENEGYTEAHMKGVAEMKETLGLKDSQVIEKKGIPESEKCYDAAVDLAEQGCKYIIGTSFGHESYIIQAAKEYPDLVFAHATGFQAASSGLKNMHNFMPKVFESRYVSGIVAGLKLNQMILDGTITESQAKIGYVGAYPYAEVVSGYTSFFLGVRSVCSAATMEVRYTNSWADMTLEKETAEALIAGKCVLISQHADTTGAPSACEARGVPCVGYNVDMTAVAPNAALTSATLDWGAFYKYSAKQVLDGKDFEVNWAKGYSDDAVYITPLNPNTVTSDAKEKTDAAIAGIKNGTVRVFDTSKFTIGGKSLETLISEGGDYAKYASYVKDGAFNEQNGFAAPAFDIRIDGIVER